MKFTVTRSTGETIIMHDAPFQFGEQGTYPIEGGEFVVHRGDVITTTCVSTNPTADRPLRGEFCTRDVLQLRALLSKRGTELQHLIVKPR